VKHQGTLLLLAEFQFRPKATNEHPHVGNGVLSAFGVHRVFAATIEAGPDALTTKLRVILHPFIVSGSTLFETRTASFTGTNV
jgi:hypothetical protein